MPPAVAPSHLPAPLSDARFSAPAALPGAPLDAGLHARLRAAARRLLDRADAPYSGRPAAAVLVLADGSAVPGVRVESASFSLSIGAVQNALTTAAALAPGIAPVLLVAAGPLASSERLLAAAFGLGTPEGDDTVRADVAVPVPLGSTDASADLVYLAPGLPAPPPRDAEAGVAMARAVSERALVPESGFHVGCVADAGGVLVPGCNVETADWGQILCAERNALGTLVSYGLPAPRTLWLYCPGEGCSPCGACRQLLAERARGASLWMPGPAGIAASTPEALLPGAFTGESLSR